MSEMVSALLGWLPGLLQTVGWALVLWVWWSMRQVFMRRDECGTCHQALNERMDALEDRQRVKSADQDRLEQALAALPTVHDIQRLALGLKDIEGDIKGLAQKVDGQGAGLARMEKAVDLLTEVHMGNKG